MAKVTRTKSKGKGKTEEESVWFSKISYLVPDHTVEVSPRGKLALAISKGTKRATKPTIPFSQIRSRLRELLSPLAPSTVGYNDKISKYIGPGPLQLVAFIDVVNKYPPFRADGLALTPPDIPDNPIVGWFLSAIVTDYEQRGWKVLL